MVIITLLLNDVVNLGNLDRAKVWVEIDGIDFQADASSYIESKEIIPSRPTLP